MANVIFKLNKFNYFSIIKLNSSYYKDRLFQMSSLSTTLPARSASS